MKIALIPPSSLVHTTNKTDYQLMLPQEMYKTKTTYYGRYESHCRDPKQFVILDNGAAEGVLQDFDALMHMAAYRKASELVIPDVLGDAQATVDLAVKFKRSYVPMRGFPPPAFGTMFVAQGRTFQQVKDTIAWACREEWITTIGIPRHMIATLNDKYARLKLAGWAAADQESFMCKPIHFLGGNELFHDEVSFLSDPNELPQHLIRGMDTSMPFNYAFAGIALDDDGPKPTKRPEGYFDLDSSDFDKGLLAANIDFFVRHHK